MNKYIPGTKIINTLKNRFYKNVSIPNERGCMEWLAAIDQTGYGVYATESNVKIGAHRYSYLLHHGKIDNGLCVMHICDNRKCVSPLHLALGSRAQNCRDRTLKNRQAKGERQGSSKLTERDVVKILMFNALGYSQAKLGYIHNVSRSCINAIIHNRSWTHLNRKQGDSK